ncbi:MAG: bifunctional heptose 7-phosphate kinase/heptose 1-phosphate adenyltransferase [Acidobacteriota bacterium]
MKQGRLRERLLRIIEEFSGKRLLVVGDMIADEFVYGKIERISREAPVLILKYEESVILPGGGANAVSNIATLGGVAIPIGVVGEDEPGRRLHKALNKKGVELSQLIVHPHYRTPTKSRILAGGLHSTKQQVLRIDREIPFDRWEELSTPIIKSFDALTDHLDAIILSDYGYGFLSLPVFQHILGEARRRGINITLDSHYNLLSFPGVTAATPNEPEVEAALQVTVGKDEKVLVRAGRALLQRLACQAVLVTRGSDGMNLFEKGKEPVHIGIYGTDEIADVTGAGDTVISVFTLALAAGATYYEAARLANYAGGIVVMKRATATVSQQELFQAVEEDNAEQG